MTLLPGHKQLLTACLLVMLAAGAGGWFYLLPLHQAVASQRNRIATQRKELQQRGFALDPSRLKSQLIELKERRRTIARRFAAVYDLALRQFGDQVQLYSSVEAYQRSITQLDYQQKFLDVKRELGARQVHLNDGILGLSEISSSPRNYQLYSQLLVVRSAGLLASEHDLELGGPELVPEDQPDAPPPARITVLPVRTYITPQDSEPYAEEYPVRLTVTGSIDNVSRFLAALTQGNRFLPPSRIALEKTNCDRFTSDRVEATVVCSGFLMLRSKEDTAPPEIQRKRPWKRGA